MRYAYAPASDTAHTAAIELLRRGGVEPARRSAAILQPAQPYDLARPGTPRGILALAKAATEGAGGWRGKATFALAQELDTGAVVASLCLRLVGDLPGRARRAWACYVRGEDGGWAGNGAGLLDSADEVRPVREVGVLELAALLRGEVYAPPPPRDVPMLACYTCQRVVRYSTTTWRPYANHRCATSTTTEGRS